MRQAGGFATGLVGVELIRGQGGQVATADGRHPGSNLLPSNDTDQSSCVLNSC